jgi:ubiquinone/menaquinone biosynthesis C-methylase UbiE
VTPVYPQVAESSQVLSALGIALQCPRWTASIAQAARLKFPTATEFCMRCRPSESRKVQAFDAWAQSYDTRRNPLLVLEQRYLDRMLPDLSGRDVLNAGCGSGRWLSRISLMGTHRVCGMDVSAGMLQAAAQKDLPGVELVQCSCDQTPYADESFDVILSSFVLSYVDDLASFAAEMSRIGRAGCDRYLSDMHPETQCQLGWKRTFQDGQQAVELETVSHRIRDVIGVFASLGWKLYAALETEFGNPEREVFEAAGRLGRFNEADGRPAIYLLHLRKSDSRRTNIEEQDEIAIGGARCVIGPSEDTSGDWGSPIS